MIENENARVQSQLQQGDDIEPPVWNEPISREEKADYRAKSLTYMK